MGRRKQGNPERDLGPFERRLKSNVATGGFEWNQLTADSIVKEEEAEHLRSSKCVLALKAGDHPVHVLVYWIGSNGQWYRNL